MWRLEKFIEVVVAEVWIILAITSSYTMIDNGASLITVVCNILLHIEGIILFYKNIIKQHNENGEL